MTCPLCRINNGKGQSKEDSCFSCAKLENLNKDVDEVKVTFDRVLERRRAYFEEMNQKCDPIQCLPFELISSIFIYCLPRPHSLDVFQDVTLDNQVEYADRPVQHLLGSICRFWRQVAWSTPQLWNILWLHFTIDSNVAFNQRVDDWLSRSRRLPLYVRMFWVPDSNYKFQAGTVAWKSLEIVIDRLSQYSHRFRVLDLSLIEDHLSYFGRQRSDSTNNILERLDIQVNHDELEDNSPFSDQFPFPCEFKLAQKPSPTCVSLKDMRIEAVDMHWSNVTHLAAIKLLKHEAVTVLLLAPQLQYFKLEIMVYPPYFLQQTVPTVIHNSLKTLQIGWDPSQKFLDHLTCPALEKLLFDIDYCPILPVESFLRRSNCPMKELVLEKVEEEHIDFVSLLQLTPLLTHLSLLECYSPHLEESLANVRRCTVQDNKFLPCLHSFQMSMDLRSPTFLSRIYDFAAPDNVVRRLWSSIKVVFLADILYTPYTRNNIPFCDRTILSQIARLIEEGVEVEIKDVVGLDLICLSRQLHGM